MLVLFDDFHSVVASCGLYTFQKSESQPTNPGNAKQTKQILQEAERTGVKFSSELISDAGRKFISAGSPDAWDAALSFLDYHSHLNADQAPAVSNPLPLSDAESKPVLTAHLLTPPNETPGEAMKATRILGVGEAIDWANSARMEPLDRPNSTNSRRQFIIFEATSGVRLLLDNLYLKNVIVRNTRVVYGGSHVKLENTYFVNCTFELPPTLQTRKLANALLTSTAITFSNKS